MATYSVNDAGVARARELIASRVYRASEWRHKAVELAAHELLQELDGAAGLA